jgi:Ca-activated chloride channel family protein
MRRAKHLPESLRTVALGLLVAVASVGALVGCSDSDERAGPVGPAWPGTEPEPRLDIDPRSYYEDYEVGADEDTGAATRAAPPQAESEAADDAAAATTDGGSSAAPDVAHPEPPQPQPPAPPNPEPGFTDDNTFTDAGDNPYVSPAEDPQSTFALDVDTGSFAIGRTFLDEGHLPEPDSIRTEEWVNAFAYDDPPPADGDLAVHVEGAPAPHTDDGTQLLRVGVRARTVEAEERPPASITLVVDTSGSMDIRERLGLVRSSLALLALHLRDDDSVSVVTYSSDASVLLPPTPVGSGAQTIVNTIGELVPTGSTNMEAGLRTGYEQARSAFREDGINAVILASDGVANTGVTGTDPLSAMVQEEGQDGIGLVTVGYGMGNYNDTLMEQLADRGDGFYAYVDTYEEAERLFKTELTSTLTVVAEEAKAQVTFDPAAVEAYRLVGYENRAIADEDFRNDSVDAGELGAGHSVTALYEVRLATEATTDELAAVNLRHRPAGGGEFVEQSVPITRADLASSLEEAAASLRLAAAVATFAEALAEHPLALDRAITLDDVATLAGSADSDELTRLVARAQELSA